jgi:hypothetical protein
VATLFLSIVGKHLREPFVRGECLYIGIYHKFLPRQIFFHKLDRWLIFGGYILGIVFHEKFIREFRPFFLNEKLCLVYLYNHDKGG